MHTVRELRVRQKHQRALSLNDSYSFLTAERDCDLADRTLPAAAVHPDFVNTCIGTIVHDFYCL